MVLVLTIPPSRFCLLWPGYHASAPFMAIGITQALVAVVILPGGEPEAPLCRIWMFERLTEAAVAPTGAVVTTSSWSGVTVTRKSLQESCYRA